MTGQMGNLCKDIYLKVGITDLIILSTTHFHNVVHIIIVERLNIYMGRSRKVHGTRCAMYT